MLGFVGIVALIILLGLSLAITRLATIALTMTGLSEEMARFQARSAFTATGFTTEESEKIVNQPVRRRIIMALMVIRSAGLLTVVLTLILSFVGDAGAKQQIIRLGVLGGGVALLWVVVKSSWTDQLMNRLMRRLLNRWADMDLRDYAGLLKLSDGYAVMEVQLREDDWLAGKKVKECSLRQEGVNILGVIRRNGDYVGVPQADTKVYSEDTLILYGRNDALQKLSRRERGGAGDREHREAVSEEQGRMVDQKRKEKEHEEKRES